MLVLGFLALATGAGPPADPERQSPEETVVSTDVFAITFSAEGGVPVRWEVVDERGKRDDATPDEPATVALVDTEVLAASSFLPLSIVLAAGEPDDPPRADRRTYRLERSDVEGTTTLVFTSPVADSGLQVVKTYGFPAEGNLFTLRVDLHNRGDTSLELAPGITLGPGLGYSPGRRPELHADAWFSSVRPFFEAADGMYSVDPPSDPPYAIDFPEEEGELVWGGLHSTYFLLGVVPRTAAGEPASFARARAQLEVSDRLAGLIDEGDREFYPCVTLLSPEASVAPGASASLFYSVYAGPKERERLRATELGLESVLFHHLWGWLAGLVRLLRFLVGALHGILGSWGWAIVVFAVLFRLAMLPLSLYGARHQSLTQAKTAALKPQIAAVKEQYKDDAVACNDAIMALYKEHGMNPISHFKGCLPLLIQIPVLIAFFQVLLFSNELRNVGFLWIDDLTKPDRLFPLGFSLPWLGAYFNLLPVIMLVAQVLVARSMRAATRSGEGGGLGIYVLPVTMTLLFYPFPAGCMLFWTTGNVLQVFEQRLMAKHKAGAAGSLVVSA